MTPFTLFGNRQRGFTLLEIMVGVAIGLIGIVVIFQVLAISEGRKRTTASGSDAQISGTIGMFSLERDLKLAGYGFGSSTFMGCTVNAYNSQRPTPAFTFGLYPVQIVQGTAGAPDKLVILRGSSSLFVENTTFAGAPTATTKTISAGQGGTAGLQKGDLLIIAGTGGTPPTQQCQLVEVTDNVTPNTQTISYDNGNYTASYLSYNGNVTSRFNPAGGPTPVVASGWIFDLGPSAGLLDILEPAVKHIGTGAGLDTWQIRNGRTLAWSNGLNYTDDDGDGQGDWIEVADGIVNLQAQYGTDTNNNGMIEAGEWTDTAPADWTKLLAIRVALLARSQQYEKKKNPTDTPVTPTAPTWAGGAFVMTNVDGTADSGPGDANDWRNYRYRVYETAVPLRNMIW